MSQDPQTPQEWQDAVDAAQFFSLAESCKMYGLITGGPTANLERCTEILKRGKEMGITPAPMEETLQEVHRMSPFKDPRSKVLWRTGRVKLKGQDKTDLRREVYNRAGGRCEEIRNGKRCNRFAAWDGLKHGELSHRKHGAHRDDTKDGVIWSCRQCHAARHPGPQFTPRRTQEPTER